MTRVLERGRRTSAFAQADLPRAESTRDHRQRVDLVTEAFLGAWRTKGDVITYASGDTSAPHLHADADHVFYVLQGRAIVHVDDRPHPLAAGDVLVVHQGEVHRFENPHAEPFSFLELWLPAPRGETTWVDPGGDR